MNVTDELLMAYADGELDESLRSELGAEIRLDPKLDLRVREHQQMRTQVQDAFAAVMDEPVPDRLTAAIHSARSDTSAVVDLGDIQKRRTGRAARWSWMQWSAMAASLLLGVLIGRIGLQTDEAGIVVRDGQLTASGRLATALEQTLSSEEGAQRIAMSFRSANGEYCRTFLSEAIAGLACRTPEYWRVTALSEPQARQGNYEPAGSSLPSSVIAAIDEMIIGEPLTIEEEAAARSAGWR